jgi:hypothetical protein
MKKTLLALAIAGAAVSAQADVSISGHVNYSAGDLKDFNGNEGFDVQNNGASGSRFRIVASKEANGITYATRQEFSVNGSSAPGGRVSDMSIAGDFGKFYLGHGWESGEDATEMDYSGTYVLTGSAYDAWDVGSNINNVDGGRDQRLRYDSPKLGGVVTLKADIDTNDNLGLAVFAGGSNWKAAIYSETKGDNGTTAVGASGNDTDEVGGSIALKVAGFTAAFQMGKKDRQKAVTQLLDVNNVETRAAVKAADEQEYRAIILGYNVGKISVAIDFANYEETDTAGVAKVDNDTQGLSFVYRPTGGVELYAGLRTADANVVGATSFNGQNDATGFLIGGRVKF